MPLHEQNARFFSLHIPSVFAATWPQNAPKNPSKRETLSTASDTVVTVVKACLLSDSISVDPSKSWKCCQQRNICTVHILKGYSQLGNCVHNILRDLLSILFRFDFLKSIIWTNNLVSLSLERLQCQCKGKFGCAAFLCKKVFFVSSERGSSKFTCLPC